MEKRCGNTKKWRKVLYEDQNVPDNYVDESFLTEMRKNIYVRTYKYWDLVKQTAIIIQQLCTVSFLVVSWWLLNQGSLTPRALLLILLPLSSAGFIVYMQITLEKDVSLVLYSSVKTAVVVLCLTDFLSPILKTLTHTISTDTIYAMSVMMILGHLLFHDYSSNAARISRAVSLNMSLFSSICLASRLESSEHVFAFVIFSLVLFGFWPMLQRSLRRYAKKSMITLTSILCILSFAMLCYIHIIVSFLFLCIVVFIGFVCPLLLVSLQTRKNNIYGPWDEAVINPDHVGTLSKSEID